MSDQKPTAPPPPTADTAPDRAARLAEQLRINLRKRKEQARSVAAASGSAETDES